jgi:hypothetical protein
MSEMFHCSHRLYLFLHEIIKVMMNEQAAIGGKKRIFERAQHIILNKPNDSCIKY